MKNLTFIIILVFSISAMAQNSKELNIGDQVSEFSGIDASENEWNSKNINADFLVVYFYPAAMTGGCTKQACAYRDYKSELDKLGAVTVGVSGDEVKNLKYFKEMHQLNFTLLSDADGKISTLFGVPTSKGGSINQDIEGENYTFSRGNTAARQTFILDKNRRLIYKNTQVNAAGDSEEVKKAILNYINN